MVGTGVVVVVLTGLEAILWPVVEVGLRVVVVGRFVVVVVVTAAGNLLVVSTPRIDDRVSEDSPVTGIGTG